MKEDRYLLGQIAEKINQCENRYIVTSTGFLDSHQQSIARQYCKKNFIPIFDPLQTGEIPLIRTMFFGGYEEAERVIMINMPDYADLERDQPLTVIRAHKAAGSKALTHRDYLGSLIGLGIKRELIGDILVREDGADIICLSDIADFILANYYKAGRVNLSLSKKSLCELIIPKINPVVLTDTTASLRLDCIVASAFGLSRGKAVSAISGGIIFVNHVEVTKADFQLKEGDKITFRGKGKAVLFEVGGQSRKERIFIKIQRY